MSQRSRWHGPQGSGALIGILTLVLGFAIAVQVRAHSSGDALSGLREDDLIGILDNQNDRAERLRDQIADLQRNLTDLRDTGNRSAAARHQAEQQYRALGILLGTLPATGPGVVVTVTDPTAGLTGEDLLDGPEAMQFGSVRVTTATSFEGSGGTVVVDGTEMPPPYRVLAIGDPKTLDTALNIPGGVAATVRAAGGELSVLDQRQVRISVTRSVPKPEYAQPSH
jgi:uncharacterized protein YlxW (UPF0749 family)